MVQFLVKAVTNNHTDETRPMEVRETAKIGEGAFGTVLRAYLKGTSSSESSTGNILEQESDWIGPFAIKKVPAQTEYKSRELEILRKTSHPNVVTLEFFFTYPNPEDRNKLYQHLVMESLPCNLQSEIKRYRVSNLILPESHIQVYAFQIARAMNYLHSFGICHRDIKPSNVLIEPDTLLLKICDFGSAKRLEPNQPSVSYICSRYYRAPELIIGCSLYTTQIDIWGLGCVLGEMFMGRPVFQGQEPMLQLREISKLLGPPDKEFIYESNPSYNGPMYNHKLYSSSVPTRFKKVFAEASPEAVDLLTKVLVYRPQDRFVPSQIMAHIFFDPLRDPNFRVTPRTVNAKIEFRDSLFNFSDYELRTLGDLAARVLPRE
ncbi:DEKNAAC102346 [Brettanomyces naardenensis]|uniref:DEKNAAC102346 n=1 Tax=Brettanomyces naardenensis TaxID=13370 RepID=A0A448YKY4_BRENA|nr:DEKNAAC102346 [Brettanomyces naardenensis]